MNSRIMATGVALVASSVLVAGCGKASTKTSNAGGSPGSAATTCPSGTAGGSGSGTPVAIKNFAYSPTPVTVRVGTTVTWTNNDATAHTVTASCGLDSKGLDMGKSFSFTFTKAGTFNYICSFHNYMKGTVVVQ